MIVNFKDYLDSTIEVANEEKAILDELSIKKILSPIEIRACKNSF
jgi:hypothetical protein